MGTKILSIPSHQFSFSPTSRFILFPWILLQPLWPFPQAFLIYLRCLSFSLTFNLHCSKSSFLLINEVLLPLKYNSQRQYHKWGSQSFSYQTHQNPSLPFSFKNPHGFPFTLPCPPSLTPQNCILRKKGISLTKTVTILFSIILNQSKNMIMYYTVKLYNTSEQLLPCCQSLKAAK